MVEFNIEPGKRVKEALGSDNQRVEAVVGAAPTDVLEVPDNPGPAMTGRTPLIGQVRRNKDLPVVRDELSGLLDD